MSESVLFDLASPRCVVLTDRNRTYTLHCRRITEADWMEYFSRIVLTFEQQGKSRIQTSNGEAPRLALVDRVLVEAEGYKVAGGATLKDIPDWQQKLPLAHRHRLGETLCDVRRSEAEDEELTIYPEGEVVLLDASYTVTFDDENPQGPGLMQKLCGLKHVLATPSEEQHRRYARESSRAKLVGGSRTGKTIYQPSFPLLAKLYDELVISVEGYAVNGHELTTDRAAIIREMDTLHKAMAAQEVFQPQDTTQLAGGDEE